MVKKFSGIPSKSVDRESWVNGGGIDPELKSSMTTAEPSPKEGKKFPHRISLDLDAATYRKLKRVAFDSDVPMNEVLREALEKHLQSVQ